MSDIQRYFNIFYNPEEQLTLENYGWSSVTHLTEEAQKIQSTAFKIFALFFAFLLDASIGGGLFFSAIYNGGVFVNNRYLQAKQLSQKFLGEKTTQWNQTAIKTWAVIATCSLFLGLYYFGAFGGLKRWAWSASSLRLQGDLPTQLNIPSSPLLHANVKAALTLPLQKTLPDNSNGLQENNRGILRRAFSYWPYILAASAMGCLLKFRLSHLASIKPLPNTPTPGSNSLPEQVPIDQDSFHAYLQYKDQFKDFPAGWEAIEFAVQKLRENPDLRIPDPASNRNGYSLELFFLLGLRDEYRDERTNFNTSVLQKIAACVCSFFCLPQFFEGKSLALTDRYFRVSYATTFLHLQENPYIFSNSLLHLSNLYKELFENCPRESVHKFYTHGTPQNTWRELQENLCRHIKEKFPYENPALVQIDQGYEIPSHQVT
jgi:hypothetical protein